MRSSQIYIYGATDIGYLIASRLFMKHDITVIDERERPPERFQGLDIAYFPGNGSDLALLERLQFNGQCIFIACKDTDETNVFACWTIKKIATVTTVCFVSSARIYQNLISEIQHKYETHFDIDTVIWPENMLTQDIFRTIMVPEAVDVEFFQEAKVKLLEYRIKEDSIIAGVRIMDYTFPRNILIVGITREDQLFIPSGQDTIEVGDKVMFMGVGSDLDLLAARLFHHRRKIKTAIIIGGGSVGYYLAQKLLQSRVRVKIVEQDKKRCHFLSENLENCLVLHADGTDIDLLESESVAQTDIVVCVTNNDEKNLLCSLVAQKLGAKRIVTRVVNTNNIQLFERVGIDIVVSAKESAMREVLNVLYANELDVLATVGGGQAEVLRLTVPSAFKQTMVKDLQLPKNVLITVIRRGKKIIIPDGSTPVRAADKLKIFSVTEKIESIQEVFNH